MCRLENFRIFNFKFMKVVIIIPTYNESESIKATIEGLQKEFNKIKSHQMHILVFDSNSKDDTRKIVKNLQKRYKNLHLQTEKEKSGLGGAYIKAMRYAMDKMTADAVFEYDADGSHQPKYISGMVKALDGGADVVVGSRYVPGGKMPADWGLHRKLMSFVGNLIARVVLLTPQYKDMTSGFRGTKTKCLKKVDLKNLLSKQFAYKLHLYYALHKLGAKIAEYPIEFIDRGRGESKFPKNNIKDSLKVVFTLRLRESQRFIKVCLVGGIGALIQFTFFNILRGILAPEWANSVAVELAIVSNFIINNSWTFADKKIKAKHGKKRMVAKFLQFNFFSLGSILIQFLVIKIGTAIFGRGLLLENLLVAVGILIGLIYNFTIYTRLIWRVHKNKSEIRNPKS